MQKLYEKITKITNIVRKFSQKIFEYRKDKNGTPYFVFGMLGVVLFFLMSSIIILIYYYFQPDIIFSDTGFFSKNGYYIFLVGILFQMLIVFFAYQLTDYIRHSSFWTEKQKVVVMYLMGMITLLTIPWNWALIRSFYTYQKGSEIFANHWLLGTFRRILNDKEREELIQETVKNFFEKTAVSKDIQEQLKICVSENFGNFHKKCEEGSSVATKYVSDQLEMQKEFLQREAVKKLELETLLEKTARDPQGWWSWMADQTKKGLMYFDPDVTPLITCAFAWISVGILLGGILIYLFPPHSSNISAAGNNVGNIPPQAPQRVPLDGLKHEVANVKEILEQISTESINNGDVSIMTQLGTEMLLAQERMGMWVEKIGNPEGIVVPEWIPRVHLSPEQKTALQKIIALDYQNDSSASAKMALKVANKIIENN